MTAAAEECADSGGEQSWISRLLRFDHDGDTFVVRRPAGAGDRLFGGLIAAQALAAAGATVDADKPPQSLHAYFVRGGRYGVDIELQVERTRDGRSFDTRRVTATQQGSVILEMLASFHRAEPGADWHPVVPATVELDEARPKDPPLALLDHFEIRTTVGDTSVFAVPPYWIRTKQPIEPDRLTRACALTLMSDLGPVPVARPPGTPLRLGLGMAASLDHAIWFHRPFRPDRWHRYEVRSLNNSDSRGLVVGSLYDDGGSLIATMTQEALWRI